MLVAPTIPIKDKSLDDLDNLLDPDVLAEEIEEIEENLEIALGSFREIIANGTLTVS